MSGHTSEEKEQAAVSFKVLTLNMHKGFTSLNRKFVLHELREAVRSVAADIVFLQEVLGSHAGHSKRHANWPKTPQYEFIADSIWQDYAYGRNAVYTRGHHGNAVLSKFPILRHQNHDITVGKLDRRGLLHCVMKIPGPELEVHAICVHLSLTEAHRRRQLLLMCDLIKSAVPASAPLIVAGDFNDWRIRAHSILARGAGLKEAYVRTAGKSAKTFPARAPALRLDRVYLRNARALQAQRHSEAPWSHLSDHAALSVEVAS
ncbi:MAG: endonuclease/exonuclease/phosphatase family protein [Nevskiales bacterium]